MPHGGCTSGSRDWRYGTYLKSSERETDKASGRPGYCHWDFPATDEAFAWKEHGLHKGTSSIGRFRAMRVNFDAYHRVGYGNRGDTVCQVQGLGMQV